MNKVYGVIFKDGNKTYNFLGDEGYLKNDYVIVETEKGIQYGKVYEGFATQPQSENLKKILRKASEEDNAQYLRNLKDAEIAL